MGVVRDVVAAASLALLFGGVLEACKSGRENDMAALNGRARAEALVESYARHVGAPGRGLEGGDDVAFGESGFQYDEASGVLIGRAFVQRVFIADAPPEELVNYRRMVGFLNDPTVGGRYDRAGGSFVLDEARNGYYLVRAFPVNHTSPEPLNAAMDAMGDVSERWVTTWLGEAAMVMHSRRPPPSVP